MKWVVLELIYFRNAPIFCNVLKCFSTQEEAQRYADRFQKDFPDKNYYAAEL